MKTVEDINWDDPGDYITENFTVHEALWLPTWRVHHQPTEEQKENILGLLVRMQAIRNLLGKPIIVHCLIRPKKVICPGTKWHGKNYNKLVAKSTSVTHEVGKGIDWHLAGFAGSRRCKTIRSSILPHLEQLGLRMEDIQGPWIHNDTMPVGNKRFFKP